MGTRKVEQGDIGRIVAAQIRQIRELSDLSLQALSDRLSEVGRPILPSGLSKIEQGTRRVDVDDLVALADALETTPSRLLRAPSDPRSPIGANPDNAEVLDAAIAALGAAEDARISRDEVVEWMDRADSMRTKHQQWIEEGAPLRALYEGASLPVVLDNGVVIRPTTSALLQRAFGIKPNGTDKEARAERDGDE